MLYLAIKYKTALVAISVLIICFGAGTLFWMKNQQSREQEAALQLSRVAQNLEQGNFALAINGDGKNSGLKKIATEYSGKYNGTPSGNMANLLLANAYYSLRDFDSALKAFKNVTIKNDDLAAAALAGAGDCYTNKNQLTEAAASYQEASKKAENSVLKVQYLVKEADRYQQLNQLKKAFDLYTKIIADYPGTSGAALAQRSLGQISGNM
jgi:tetratricopeptide (TPR) repeat protein